MHTSATQSLQAGLAIDLGGTKISAALFDESGQLSPVEVRYLEGRGGATVVTMMLELVQHFRDWADAHAHQIAGVGVAVPGIYYAQSGEVWAPNIPDWDNYPLRDELTKQLPMADVPVRVDSDRACYILGEGWKGAAQASQHAIFLAVGTGIGAGILINGQVLRGAHDIAGAIGWMALQDPYLPGYETYGCFEYHASGDGLSRMADGRTSGREIFEAYEQEDPEAIRIIRQAIRLWGKASANLVSLFNPEKIIFGGGVFGPAIPLIDDIYAEATKWAQPISIQQVSFEASQLGSEAGLYGAGRLALQSLTNSSFQ